MEVNKVTLHEAKELDCAQVLRAQLYAKVELIANAIGALQKDGTNRFTRYNYISHEAVTTAIRPLLLKYSLSVVMDIEDYKERDFESTNSKGEVKVTTRTIMICRFYITDTETGYQESHRWIGAEQDNGGKSMQQAATQANKYFLFKLFKITDKDSDSDETTNEITPPKFELAGLKSILNQCKTEQAIKDFYNSIPASRCPDGFKEAAVERREKINKVSTYTQPSTDGKKEYTQSFSIVGGWNCTCASTSKNCKHIKASKVLSL